MDAMRLVATGIVAGFEGREVLRGLDLEVPAGARLALLGANARVKPPCCAPSQVRTGHRPGRFSSTGIRCVSTVPG